MKNGFQIPESLSDEYYLYYTNLKSIGVIFDDNQLHFNDIIINLESNEDLFIACEVFYYGSYNFTYPDKSVVVYDVGSNIGISTLFFSAQSNVDKVFAYEPAKPTYEKLKNNLKLNSAYSNKIYTINHGLSNVDEIISVEYTDEYKGSVGIKGLDLHQKRNSYNIDLILKNASTVFSETLNVNKINILKLDCEGCEYKILSSLLESGLLTKFNLMMIEWHDFGYNSIIEVLKSNFVTIATRSEYSRVGMIYATQI